MDSVDIKSIDGAASEISVFIHSENGDLSGTVKDRKSRAMAAIAGQEWECAAQVPDLWVITSGNAVASLRGALNEVGLEATITAFVNESPYTHPLMMEHIQELADNVVEMPFGFDETPDTQIQRAEEAYRGVVWDFIREGVIPDHLYLPVGSGELASQLLLASRWLASYRFLSSEGQSLGMDPVKAMEEIYRYRAMPSGRTGFGTDDRMLEGPKFSGLQRFCSARGIPFDLEQVRSLFPNVVLSSEEGQFLSRFGYDGEVGEFFVSLRQYPGSDLLTHVSSRPGVARKLALPCMSKTELRSGGSLFKTLSAYPHERVRIVLCSGEEITSGWEFLRDHSSVKAEPSGAVPFTAFLKEMRSTDCPVSRGETVVVLNSGCGSYITPDGEQIVHFDPADLDKS